MPLLLLLFLLAAGCAPWHRAPLATEDPAEPDSLTDEGWHERADGGLLTARWHLLRAQEARVDGRFDDAQADLDAAFQAVTRLEDQGADESEVQPVLAAIEQAYLDLIPHLKQFSPDSPLVLLLEGISEERIEALPPDATELVRIHQMSQRCDMPIDANAKVAASIRFFQTRGRATYIGWLRRANRYRDLVLQILREEGVPADLFYLAMIESGFNPQAYSPAKAVGMWQFMDFTGRDRGLRQDAWVDERRDPVRATHAAARHLRDLYAVFQDWRLALAAYNAGEGRVSRAIAQAGHRDYWRLSLPAETANYVPMYMAATVLAKDPRFWGIDPAVPEAPLAFDEIELPPKPASIDLRAAARCLGVNATVLHDLNPELRQRVTPPQRAGQPPYRLRVPVGAGAGFLALYASLPEAEKSAYRRHKVRRGETLATIARHFGVAPQAIASCNGLRKGARLRPGRVLRIPADTEAAVAGEVSPAPAAPAGVPAPGATDQRIHTVKRGETLSAIGRRYGVTATELTAWNGLHNARLQPGDRLLVSRPGASVRQTAAPPRRQPPEKASAGPSRPTPRYHTVQRGESLWGIARTSGVAVADLRAWNGLQGNQVRAGQRLALTPPPATAGKTTASSAAAGKAKKAQPRVVQYRVARGDTLSSIARRFGVEPVDLARHNKLKVSSTLLAGTTLTIPRQAAPR